MFCSHHLHFTILLKLLQFEDEFSIEANYDFLERTEIPSPPAGCPVTMNKVKPGGLHLM
jgi:hypothetical protein